MCSYRRCQSGWTRKSRGQVREEGKKLHRLKAGQGRLFRTNEIFLHGPRTLLTCPMAISQKDLLSKWGQGHGKKLGVEIT